MATVETLVIPNANRGPVTVIRTDADTYTYTDPATVTLAATIRNFAALVLACADGQSVARGNLVRFIRGGGDEQCQPGLDTEADADESFAIANAAYGAPGCHIVRSSPTQFLVKYGTVTLATLVWTLKNLRCAILACRDSLPISTANLVRMNGGAALDS